MYSLRNLTRLASLRTHRQCIPLARHLHDEFANDPPKLVPNPKNKFRITTPAVASKFNVYSDDNASVIFDVEEERLRITEDNDRTDDLLDSAYSGLNLESKRCPSTNRNCFFFLKLTSHL